jgi:hypothetical protein
MTRPAEQVSPNGLRRPHWLLRPFRPDLEAYRLPGRPQGNGKAHEDVPADAPEQMPKGEGAVSPKA